MWKITEGQSLTWRGWDDEYVVFNDLSGDTHLLGADAMDILLQLQTGPVSEDALALALQVSGYDREVFALTLGQLGALSLIEHT